MVKDWDPVPIPVGAFAAVIARRKCGISRHAHALAKR